MEREDDVNYNEKMLASLHNVEITIRVPLSGADDSSNDKREERGDENIELMSKRRPRRCSANKI